MELSLEMKEKRLGPEEILLKENETTDKLYFVMKGKGKKSNNIKQKKKQKNT